MLACLLGDLAGEKQQHFQAATAVRGGYHQAHTRKHRAMVNHKSCMLREPLRGPPVRDKPTLVARVFGRVWHFQNPKPLILGSSPPLLFFRCFLL